MSISLSVIIVTYNSSKVIEECLNKILLSKIGNVILSIIVIDNDSTDDTLDKLNEFRQNHKITILENKKNFGFSKAINKGIKYKKSDFYLLVNPDAFIERDCIHKLIRCSIDNNLGICGGSTKGLNGEEQGDHFRTPNLLVGIFDFTNFRKVDFNNKWNRYFYYRDETKNNSERNVGSVSGGLMLISNDVIKKIGLLDERYFMYLEDVDYCYQANLNNINVTYCPDAKAVHIGGASSNNKERSNLKAWFDSRRKYYLKNFNLLSNLIIQPIFIVDEFLIKTKKYFNENFDN